MSQTEGDRQREGETERQRERENETERERNREKIKRRETAWPKHPSDTNPLIQSEAASKQRQ